MIRQAHTYLVGAMGGAMLIAIAIAVFVMLVSAQVLRNWPIGALGGGEEAAVSEAQPAGGQTSGDAGLGDANAAANGAAADGQAGDGANRAGGLTASGGGIAGDTGGRGNATEPGGGGDQGGGSAGSPQTTPNSAAGGNGTSSSAGGAAGGGGKSSSGGGSSSPSGQVASTANNTVKGVDESALGGALGGSGVTETTESAVNGVAGPESAVGKVVDEAVGAVGGILGDKP